MGVIGTLILTTALAGVVGTGLGGLIGALLQKDSKTMFISGYATIVPMVLFFSSAVNTITSPMAALILPLSSVR